MGSQDLGHPRLCLSSCPGPSHPNTSPWPPLWWWTIRASKVRGIRARSGLPPLRNYATITLMSACSCSSTSGPLSPRWSDTGRYIWLGAGSWVEQVGLHGMGGLSGLQSQSSLCGPLWDKAPSPQVASAPCLPQQPTTYCLLYTLALKGRDLHASLEPGLCICPYSFSTSFLPKLKPFPRVTPPPPQRHFMV